MIVDESRKGRGDLFTKDIVETQCILVDRSMLA